MCTHVYVLCNLDTHPLGVRGKDCFGAAAFEAKQPNMILSPFCIIRLGIRLNKING